MKPESLKMNESVTENRNITTIDWLNSLNTRIKVITDSYTNKLANVLTDFTEANAKNLGELQPEKRFQSQTSHFILAKELLIKFQQLTNQVDKELHTFVFNTSPQELENKFPLVKRQDKQKTNLQYSDRLVNGDQLGLSVVNVEQQQNESAGQYRKRRVSVSQESLEPKKIKSNILTEDELLTEDCQVKEKINGVSDGDDDNFDSDVEVISVVGFVPSSSKKGPSSSSDSTALVSQEKNQVPGFSGSFRYTKCNKPSNGPSGPNLVFNYYDCVDCDFCAINLEPNTGIVVQACKHVFCRACLKKRIDSFSTTQVSCPLDCGHFLYDREIKALLSPIKYDAFTQRGLENGLMFRCTTPDCTGYCVLEEDRQNRIFLCGICDALNCIDCKGVHEGLDCEKYKKLREEADKAEGPRLTDAEILEKAGINTNFGCKEMTKLLNGLLPNVSKDNLALYYDAASQVLEKLKVVSTDAEFECLICSRMNSEVERGGIILQQCTHAFCRECLEEVVKGAEKIPVPCPYIDNDSGPCEEFLTNAEFKALASTEVYEKHVRWGWRIAEDVIQKKFRCVGKNCEGFWEIDDRDGNGMYNCPVCQQLNCVICNAIHEGSTCEAYQELMRREAEILETGGTSEDLENRRAQLRNELASEEEVNRMLAQKQFMRCPYCNFVCEKISGCAAVRCLNRACAMPFTWYDGMNSWQRGLYWRPPAPGQNLPTPTIPGQAPGRHLPLHPPRPGISVGENLALRPPLNGPQAFRFPVLPVLPPPIPLPVPRQMFPWNPIPPLVTQPQPQQIEALPGPGQFVPAFRPVRVRAAAAPRRRARGRSRGQGQVRGAAPANLP